MPLTDGVAKVQQSVNPDSATPTAGSERAREKERGRPSSWSLGMEAKQEQEVYRRSRHVPQKQDKARND